MTTPILHALAAITFAAPTAAPAADNDWMAGIAGNPRISQITIPGTHDSGARFETVSDAIQPKLAAQLAGTPPGHYGCILMDFADAKLCRLIYHKNTTGK